MKKESMVTISITLIIAVALFAGGGYYEGGFPVVFNRASMLSGIIALAVAIYFAVLRLLRNHIESFFITGIMILKDPKITGKSIEEINNTAKELQKAIETINKALH